MAAVATLIVPLSGCYMVDFFKHKPAGARDTEDVFAGRVIGAPLGAKAGEVDEAALAAVHQIAAASPPAPIRPDPDLFARRVLKQFRDEDTTLAKVIGDVERYKVLLGGASQDFRTMPQETYDATSLLAVAKVAEETCRALVAPTSGEHPGWTTILPEPPQDAHGNLVFLMQRLTGRPNATIDEARVGELQQIMDASDAAEAGGDPRYARYVPACAAILLDAEALYL
jgi:hypothetical protein